MAGGMAEEIDEEIDEENAPNASTHTIPADQFDQLLERSHKEVQLPLQTELNKWLRATRPLFPNRSSCSNSPAELSPLPGRQ